MQNYDNAVKLTIERELGTRIERTLTLGWCGGEAGDESYPYAEGPCQDVSQQPKGALKHQSPGVNEEAPT